MSNYQFKYILLLILTLFLYSSCCRASLPEKPRLITVIGESNIVANPDLIKISLTISKQAKQADKANLLLNKQLLTIQQYCKLNNINMFISQISINQNVSESYFDNRRNKFNQSQFDSYEVIREITLTIHKFEKYEKIITDLLALGIDSNYNVQFALKDLQKFKEKARLIALDNAKKKAQILAEKMDEEIDETFSIQEESLAPWSEFFTQSKNKMQIGKNSPIPFSNINQNDNLKTTLSVPASKLTIGARLIVTFTLD